MKKLLTNADGWCILLVCENHKKLIGGNIMLKTAIWATCDKCGRECSSIREKKYPEIDEMKKIEIEENVFSYWKISMTHHDCRFGNGNPMETILCTDCAQKFYTEFLRKD